MENNTIKEEFFDKQIQEEVNNLIKELERYKTLEETTHLDGKKYLTYLVDKIFETKDKINNYKDVDELLKHKEIS